MAGLFRADWLEAAPVVGILRGFDRDATVNILHAAQRGGLRQIEITMNTAGAVELIRLAAGLLQGAMNLGAGTVLTEAQLDQALEAGAGFIVTPVVNEAVIRRCVERAVPVFPGALSPTEILRAWDLGATMVKVFPADQLGPAYLRALKAPLPQVRLMPTGGVSLDNLAAYAGVADAYGVGSPLFRADRIRVGDWGWVEAQCRAFVEACQRTGRRHAG